MSLSLITFFLYAIIISSYLCYEVSDSVEWNWNAITNEHGRIGLGSSSDFIVERYEKRPSKLSNFSRHVRAIPVEQHVRPYFVPSALARALVQ